MSALAVPTGGVVGSPEQEAIWQAIRDGVDHVVVQALAGTGKSFTCREAMIRSPRHLKVLYLAFNKVIADEFGRGAPGHCEVRTLNALGFRIVKGAMRCEVDGYRLDRLIESVYPAAAARRDVAAVLGRLVSLCKSYLIDGSDVQQVLDLAARQEIDIDTEAASVIPLIPDILSRCRSETAVIDFDDQVWLPVVLGLATATYDLIFVDEAQDLSPVQHALVMKLIRPGNGRVVVVGDNNQAIYGWRGSDVDSIANLSGRLETTGLAVQTLPLTVTRRCPRRVVEAAREYVPALQALPNAPDGEVVTVKDAKAIPMYKPGDMVVCRTNAPLLGVAFQLIKLGTKAVIRGRDIGQGLQALIRNLRAGSVSDLLRRLDEWETREIRKVEGTRRAESAIQKISDRADCIRSLAEECDTIDDLKARIDSIFTNFEANGAPKSAVVLSSIHRAKGLEADSVFWLYPDIKCTASQEWQKTQERNLRYVAVTRAKVRLIYVTR